MVRRCWFTLSRPARGAAPGLAVYCKHSKHGAAGGRYITRLTQMTQTEYKAVVTWEWCATPK